MNLLRIDLELPEDLAKRAEAVGVGLDDVSADVIAAVEKRIARKEAARELLEIMGELAEIPDHEKPSEKEIAEIVEQVRTEQAAQRNAG